MNHGEVYKNKYIGIKIQFVSFFIEVDSHLVLVVVS